MSREIVDVDGPPPLLLSSVKPVISSGAAPIVQKEPVELLPHQVEAVSKLRGRGGVVSRLIGDEMRVGKTPTAIALDLDDRDYFARKQRGNNCTLIACPKSVLSVWETWLENMGIHHSQITVVDLPAKTKIRKVLSEIAKSKQLKDAPARYVVVNWDSVKLLQTELIKAGPWFHCIGDEIHAIKDYNLERAKAWKRIKPKVKTALSGTPADNKPEDFWSPLNWLYPRKYSGFWDFARRVCSVSVNRKTGYEYIDGVNMTALPTFHREIEPFYIRRLLRDVAKYLPEVQYQTVYVDMGKKQRADYDKLLAKAYLDMEVSGTGEIETILTPTQVEWLTRAQQLAIGVCKINAKGMPELVDKPKSPKIDYVEDWIKDNPGEPLIVFAQHQATVARIRERLSEYSVVGLTGADSAGDRARAIEEFQTGKPKIFVGTLRACRQGIDLSRANTAILFDKDWNPSYNEQLTFRFQNMNTRDPKTFIFLESRDSVDQYRSARIAKKASDVAAIVNPTTP